MRLSTGCLVLLASCSAIMPAWGNDQDEAPRAWMGRMTQAANSLSYEGRLVFMYSNDMESMKILHAYDKQHGVRERLTSLTGEAREVIRDKDMLTCIWPRSRYVMVEPRHSQSIIPADLGAKVDQLDRFYNFKMTGNDRIAGRDCQYVDIRPQDRFRYGHRLCIGTDTGLLLSSIILDARHKPIEQVMFTHIQLRDSISEQHFKPSLKGKDYTWHTLAADKGAAGIQPDMGWQIGKRPAGFTISGNTKRIIAASSRPVQQIILTDGLASVSIFIAEMNSRHPIFKGATHKGAMHAFSRSIDDHQVTVVGEVPEATVQMIGDSLTHN